MTNEAFKREFKRLCAGFRYQPGPTQLEAFYERLQHYDAQDWHEAVTDLLCAPRFPMNLEMILEVVEKRAEQRRRASIRHEQYQTKRQITQLTTSTSMREAIADNPDLMAPLLRLLKHDD